MTKYWQEDPNHKAEWGESGGLPIEPRTVKRPLDVVGLLVDQDDKAIVSDDEEFILSGNITIQYGGAGGNIPINSQEQQRQRELPGYHKAFTNVINDTDTRNY